MPRLSPAPAARPSLPAPRLAAAAALALLSGACAAQAPRYHLVNLGNVMMATARGVADDGTVYGAWAGQPAYWNGQAWRMIQDGHRHGAVTANQDTAGLLAGTVTRSNGVQAGVVWHGKGTDPARIANPSGGVDVAPTAMNASQVVVGNADQAPGGALQRCFRWEAGVSQDLGTLAAGDACTASGIDDQGVIAGTANVVPGGPGHAFTWQDGRFTDLGSLGAEGATAAGINRLGHVVGTAALSPQAGQAIGHAYLWTGGALRDLGTLGGANSTAVAVNASDTVVGYSDTLAGSSGFLWSNGTMYPLESLVDGADGWLLSGPAAIGDSGVIVGLGFYQHFAYSFMLVPE